MLIVLCNLYPVEKYEKDHFVYTLEYFFQLAFTPERIRTQVRPFFESLDNEFRVDQLFIQALSFHKGVLDNYNIWTSVIDTLSHS